MRAALGLAASLALAGPALAVGLGPLEKAGDTMGPAKAFYLTVINPYDGPRTFRAYAEGPAGAEAQPEAAASRVSILPATMTIKAGGQRRIVVILRDLAPGETREQRICAELAQQEGMVHARVCSKLSARRIAGRA